MNPQAFLRDLERKPEMLRALADSSMPPSSGRGVVLSGS